MQSIYLQESLQYLPYEGSSGCLQRVGVNESAAAYNHGWCLLTSQEQIHHSLKS